MIYSSLAVIALSASAVINPFTNLVHMHPRAAQADSRVKVMLYNTGNAFYDVKVDGHTYTVLGHHTITVKAPAGTRVYAASSTFQYHRGQQIVEITPELNNQRVSFN